MLVQIVAAENVGPEHVVIDCRDNESREVKFP